MFARLIPYYYEHLTTIASTSLHIYIKLMLVSTGIWYFGLIQVCNKYACKVLYMLPLNHQYQMPHLWGTFCRLKSIPIIALEGGSGA